MTITLRIATSALFLILSLFPGFAQPLPSSQGFHSQVRLLSGGRQGQTWFAGIEIILDEGFKTYWRNPGEAGLPPSFDWSGSENVAKADVQWPAPTRHEDAAGIAYIYSNKVVLPVVITPAAANKPIKLALTIDYGICKDICIPAHADLNLPLSEGGPDRTPIEEAIAKVPQQKPLGGPGELAIQSVQAAGGDKPTLSVAVRAPEGAKPVLFAEMPDNWYASTSLADDAGRFTVVIEEKPQEAAGSVPLTLTLVAGDKAIETHLILDGNGHPH